MDGDARTIERTGPQSSDDTPLRLRDALIVAAAFLFPVAFSPNVYAAFWTPKAALCLVVLGVGLPALMHLATRRDFGAIAVSLFVVLSFGSAALSDRPALSVFGLYNSGLGALFFATVASAWALGRSLDSSRSREWLLVAVLGSVGVNAFVAIAQTVVDLSVYQLGRSFDRADGLLGNPVHLGALTAAALAAAVDRWCSGGARGLLPAITLFAIALELSGTRFALAATGVAMLVLMAKYRSLRGAAAVAAMVVGLGLGAAIAATTDAQTGTTRASAQAASGVKPRMEIWLGGARAFADRPVAGWGPGRFREATGSRRSFELAQAEGPEAQFLDAHNVGVELAVTTGLLGLAAALAWGVASVRRAGGPLLVFALVGLSLLLVQPMNVSTVPVAALCLGAAMANQALTRTRAAAWRVAGLTSAAIGTVGAALLLYADYTRLESELDFDLARASQVDSLSPPWPETASLIGKVHLFRALIPNPDDPALLQVALDWRVAAAERDPSDSRSWSDVGELAMTIPRFDLAEEAFARALEANPQSSRAFLGQGELERRRGNLSEALKAYRAALLRENLPANQEFIRRRVRLVEADLGGD